MAYGIYVAPTSYAPEVYDDSLARLEAAGAGTPPGRLYHFALETGGQIQVFDVWDSEEAFQAFGETLMPILAELGVDPGQPQVSVIRKIIIG
jgi:hypothetical protein